MDEFDAQVESVIFPWLDQDCGETVNEIADDGDEEEEYEGLYD